MIVFDRGGPDKFAHVQSEYPCPCGELLVQLRGTTYLYCRECGEERWLIPS